MNRTVKAVENNLGLASQYLLILHYVITETHTTLILVHLTGQMATTVSIFVTIITFTVELSYPSWRKSHFTAAKNAYYFKQLAIKQPRNKPSTTRIKTTSEQQPQQQQWLCHCQ
jgi:hypothetical protein